MAEFLQILSEQFDYPQLAEEVLKWVPLAIWNSSHVKQRIEQYGIQQQRSERAKVGVNVRCKAVGASSEIGH
jgi:hypothetical protein